MMLSENVSVYMEGRAGRADEGEIVRGSECYAKGVVLVLQAVAMSEEFRAGQ